MPSLNHRIRRTLLWLQEHVNTYVIFGLLSLAVFILPVLDPIGSSVLSQLSTMAIFFVVVLNIPRYYRVAIWIAILAIGLKVFASRMDFLALTVLANLLSLLLFGYGVWGLILSIIRQDEVNVEVLITAISGYLLLGLLFAVMIGFLSDYDPGAFDFGNSGVAMTNIDIKYYSYVTLSTLGYGDITPQSLLAKSVAILIPFAGRCIWRLS